MFQFKIDITNSSLKSNGVEFENKIAKILTKFDKAVARTTKPWSFKYSIINHSLYIFYTIFHCGLYCRTVSITDYLCTKQGNSSIFGPYIRSL